MSDVADLTLEGGQSKKEMHSGDDPSAVMPQAPQGGLWKKHNISGQLALSQRSPVPRFFAHTAQGEVPPSSRISPTHLKGKGRTHLVHSGKDRSCVQGQVEQNGASQANLAVPTHP
jgi:hypothetical protein